MAHLLSQQPHEVSNDDSCRGGNLGCFAIGAGWGAGSGTVAA